MCGRADDDFGPVGWEVLSHTFGPLGWAGAAPRPEVRPTDPLRFIRLLGRAYSLHAGRWGLVPPGMTVQEANQFKAFNARIETLGSKPMFRTAFHSRRCVVPLAAFFEWPVSRGVKTKVRISRRDGKPLLVAGLWSLADTPAGELLSCTLVTRPCTPDLLDVHARMPALLLTKDLPAWLSAPPHQAQVAAFTSWQPRILKVEEVSA